MSHLRGIFPIDYFPDSDYARVCVRVCVLYPFRVYVHGILQCVTLCYFTMPNFYAIVQPSNSVLIATATCDKFDNNKRLKLVFA